MVRAVHLELVESLSYDDTALAIRRFAEMPRYSECFLFG